MPKYLVQDIETVPESEIVDMWTPSEADKERYPDREPFPPIWCHKVICIGMLALDQDYMPIKAGCAAGGLQGGKSEKEMIERWSDAASGKLWGQPKSLHLVDYNGTGFDVPVLQTRAFRHGLQLPWYFSLLPDNRGEISNYSKEYRDKWNGKHCDVQELWTNRRMFRYPHLANLACLMGLPGKVGIDGSKVHEAYKQERFAEIDAYCLQDVFQTAFVFFRIEYMRAEMDLDQYRQACRRLLELIEQEEEHREFLAQINRHELLLEPRK